MHELLLDGKRYISSKRASEIATYSKDYVGQLCRAGKLDCRLVGRTWYVNERSIYSHKLHIQETLQTIEGDRQGAVKSEAPVVAHSRVSVTGNAGAENVAIGAITPPVQAATAIPIIRDSKSHHEPVSDGVVPHKPNLSPKNVDLAKARSGNDAIISSLRSKESGKAVGIPATKGSKLFLPLFLLALLSLVTVGISLILGSSLEYSSDLDHQTASIRIIENFSQLLPGM